MTSQGAPWVEMGLGSPWYQRAVERSIQEAAGRPVRKSFLVEGASQPRPGREGGIKWSGVRESS